MKASILSVLALSFSVFSLSACEKEEDKETVSKSFTEERVDGTLKIAFSNETNTFLLANASYITPSYFGLKIVSVELIDEFDRYISIWVNPACSAETLYVDEEVAMTEAEKEDAIEKIREKEGIDAGIDIDPGETKIVQHKYFDAQKCYAKDIGDFVDLARTSEQVNAEINSQDLPVPKGRYKSVSIRLCGVEDAAGFKAIKFQAAGMNNKSEVTGSGCGVAGAPINPIDIEEGDSATIQLAYDISTFVEKTSYDSLANLPDPSANANCYLDQDNLSYYCSKMGAGSITPTLLAR